MKQPELGRKLAEKRVKLGLTQEQLAEKTNINIRTIQRIESGDVMPRASTLGIIIEVLELNFKDINGDEDSPHEVKKPEVLKAAWIAFFVFTISWGIGVTLIFIELIFDIESVNHLLASNYFIGIILIIFIARGKIYIGKKFNNEFFVITGITDIILIFISNILQALLLYIPNLPLAFLAHFILMALGVNGLFYGAGILLLKQYQNDLTIAAGIAVCFVSLFFLIPVDLIHLIGCVVAIPSLILQTIMFYQFYTQENISLANVNS